MADKSQEQLNAEAAKVKADADAKARADAEAAKVKADADARAKVVANRPPTVRESAFNPPTKATPTRRESAYNLVK